MLIEAYRRSAAKMNRGVYIGLLFLWLIVSAVISFVGTVLILETTVVGSLLSNASSIVGWGMVLGIFVIFQLLMYKSGALSRARIKPREEIKTYLPQGPGGGWSAEQNGGVTTARGETSPHGWQTQASVTGASSRPISGGVEAAGRVSMQKCPICGGTGVNKVTGWKTVMETQTVYEQVTQFQFGKPVRVTVPRQVTRQVQKPDYKMVNCYKCKGTGKI